MAQAMLLPKESCQEQHVEDRQDEYWQDLMHNRIIVDEYNILFPHTRVGTHGRKVTVEFTTRWEEKDDYINNRTIHADDHDRHVMNTGSSAFRGHPPVVEDDHMALKRS